MKIHHEVEHCHYLLRELKIVRDCFRNGQSILEFLIQVEKDVVEPNSNETDRTVRESLCALLSKLGTKGQWVSSYIERTETRIKYLFYLTEVRISEQTSKLLEATQNDSSSMTTCVLIVSSLTHLFVDHFVV